MKKLSFVIVEYHSVFDVLQAVSFIDHFLQKIDYEIIVSSNSCYSEQRKREIINEKKFNVKWLFNSFNGGFAYAMNQGLKMASGDYLIVMNPDVRLVTRIDEMISFLDSHVNVGAIAPQIINTNSQIQDSCRNFITLLSFFKRHFSRLLFSSISARYRCF